MLTDSDLSDAPEDVTFEKSKEASSKLKLNHTRLQQNIKEKRKAKNRQREELFTQQKRAKMSRLAAEPLPDDVIDALPDSDPEVVNSSPTNSFPVANHIEFSSEDEEDVDSGINSTVTSKITVQETRAIKAKAFSSALTFKSVKESGAHENIKRQTARERQMLKEKKEIKRKR
ncbi:coiled-coil domain-containing protein 43 homolog [Watersipora subatra]|uniref:coiled-coil domain-containing protein 43 homolog n=1 Tax=Watersipora subatra TaxID=2589382 RepID=UPI00355BF58F